MLPEGMTVPQLLLSMKGRIPRSTLWLRFALPLYALIFIAAGVDLAIGSFDREAGIGLFSGLLTLLAVLPSIAVCIKRFHDRNHPGWFYLLCFIPILGIWPLIELYFLRGTHGDNDYGPDPLADQG